MITCHHPYNNPTYTFRGQDYCLLCEVMEHNHTPRTPDETRQATNEDIENLIYLGRNETAYQFFAWYRAGRVSLDLLRVHLLDIWVAAEWPLDVAGAAMTEHSDILTMFRSAGFLCDDPTITRPLSPLTLYRGCHESNVDNFSWSTSRDVAVKFAYRARMMPYRNPEDDDDGGRACVIEAVIPSEHILAMVIEGRGESEVIVDYLGARDAIWNGRYDFTIPTATVEG